MKARDRIWSVVFVGAIIAALGLTVAYAIKDGTEHATSVEVFGNEVCGDHGYLFLDRMSYKSAPLGNLFKGPDWKLWTVQCFDQANNTQVNVDKMIVYNNESFGGKIE